MRLFGDDVIAYIENHMSCSKEELSERHIKMKTHEHRFCLDRNKDCQYNFPRPPMPATHILLPQDEDSVGPKVLKKLQRRWRQLNFF